MDFQGRFTLELNVLSDGKMWLNYWDSEHGNDVCVQIVGENAAHLMLDKFDENGDFVVRNEISLFDFIERVKESVLKQ